MFADSKLNKYFMNDDESRFVQRIFSLHEKEIKIIDSPIMDDCRDYALYSINNIISKRTGKVYIANNLNHINHLKIGRTFKSITDREKSLNSAGVIGSVKILCWVDTIDCVHTETLVHRKLKQYNIEKEFYSIDYQHAMHTIKECAQITTYFYDKLLENISAS